MRACTWRSSLADAAARARVPRATRGELTAAAGVGEEDHPQHALCVRCALPLIVCVWLWAHSLLTPHRHNAESLNLTPTCAAIFPPARPAMPAPHSPPHGTLTEVQYSCTRQKTGQTHRHSGVNVNEGLSVSHARRPTFASVCKRKWWKDHPATLQHPPPPPSPL